MRANIMNALYTEGFGFVGEGDDGPLVYNSTSVTHQIHCVVSLAFENLPRNCVRFADCSFLLPISTLWARYSQLS